MNVKAETQEYTELLREWTEAEAARQRCVDRLMALDGRIALHDPIWEEWDRADEMAGHARETMRSYLAAEEHARL